MPTGSERMLDSRSLSADHRRLAQLLLPGMSVLDVGCGSGAITAGIADAVGPSGTVVGVDVSEELLAQAAASHSGQANLSFEIADVEVTNEVELTKRGDADFERRMSLWPSMIATRGHQIVADEMLEEPDRAAAGEAFTEWVATEALLQSLYLTAATGTKRQTT
jgi:SAM-dependent methyltransferase